MSDDTFTLTDQSWITTESEPSGYRLGWRETVKHEQRCRTLVLQGRFRSFGRYGMAVSDEWRDLPTVDL